MSFNIHHQLDPDTLYSVQVQVPEVPSGLREGDSVLLHSVRQALTDHGPARALPQVGEELRLHHHQAALQVRQWLGETVGTQSSCVKEIKIGRNQNWCHVQDN